MVNVKDQILGYPILRQKKMATEETSFVDCFPWFMMFLWTLGFPVFHVWWLPVGISSFLFWGASRGFHDYDVPPAGPPLWKKIKNNLKPWKGDGWEIMIWYSFRMPILMVWQDEVIRINHPKVINCYDRVSLKLNQPGVYDILRYCYRLGITFPTWYIPERGIADLVRGFSYCVGWFVHGA